MKLKDMEPNIRYVVTKGGTTLFKGDVIWIEELKGNLKSKQTGGWLIYDDWKYLRNEVEISTKYYIDQFYNAMGLFEKAKSQMIQMLIKAKK